MIGGAASLAIFANLYELLCTSGFPMVYTKFLTLRDLPLTEYHAYLVLYNVIYVIPLAVIVAGFTLTLGARKLTEFQGRILKLLSGLMMASLGLVLLFAPHVLQSAAGSLMLLLGAVGVILAIVGIERLFSARHPLAAGPGKTPEAHPVA